MRLKTPSQTDSSKKRFPRNRERGIALLIVTVMITIIGTLAADFAYNARVELESATNARDQLRAEYLARSSVNFAQLLISAQEQWTQQVKNLPKIPGFSLDSIAITDYADLIIGFLLSGDEALLPKNSSLSLRITYEDGKYPFHCSGGLNPTSAQQKSLYYLLSAMFRSNRYDNYFNKPGRDGLQISRENLPRYLIDWIDVDEQAFEPERPSSASEERYDRGPEPYEAHNLYMDTIDELHLIHGVETEAIFQTLAKTLTIYHTQDCKVSLSGIGPDSWPLLSGILSAASSDKTTAFDPNTEWVAKQLAPMIKTMWPMLRDQSLSDILKSLSPGANESSLKPPNGQTSFCAPPPSAAACPLVPPSPADTTSTTPSTSSTRSATTPPTSSSGTPSDKAVNNLSELICSPFLAKLVTFNQQGTNLPLAAETPKPAAPPVPLRSIPLCPGTLALFLKTPDATTPRRFYRIEAVGQVERKQNASEVRIQAVWDAATIIANPLCDLPKCKRGAWVYFRVN